MQACRPWKVAIISQIGDKCALFYQLYAEAEYSANWFNRVSGGRLVAEKPVLDHAAALEDERWRLRIAVNEIISEKLLTRGP